LLLEQQPEIVVSNRISRIDLERVLIPALRLLEQVALPVHIADVARVERLSRVELAGFGERPQRFLVALLLLEQQPEAVMCECVRPVFL
jgi:hypothetical protein